MSNENFNLIEELNQIEKGSQEILEQISLIREQSERELVSHFEEMETNSQKIVTEIEEIRSKINNEAEKTAS